MRGIRAYTLKGGKEGGKGARRSPIWFATINDKRIREAAVDAGGFWISGFGMQPPAFGGRSLSRIDVVLTAHGLDPFAIEYERTIPHEIEGEKPGDS